MYILAVTLLIIGYIKADFEKIACGGIIFNHVYYDKEYIICNLGRPYNLMYHKYTHVIYFSHTIQKGNDIDFTIMACNVDKKDCFDINGVPGGYAIAYDSGNDDIFVGGHDGIYKYNFITNKAEHFAERGKSVWALFVRRNFYYIEYPRQRLYVFRTGRFVPVQEALNIEIDQFYISKNGDIYFANRTALYKVLRQTRRVTVLNPELVIRQIATDRYGDVYFCANDGIYVEDKPFPGLKKLADIDEAFGLAFDQDDQLIYSDKNCIYKLVHSPNAQVCYEALASHQESQRRKMIY